MTNINLTVSKEGAIGLCVATTIAALGTLILGSLKNSKKAEKLEERSRELLIKEANISTRETFAPVDVEKGGDNE